MSEIIKIALLGIAGVLFAIQFRQQRPEYTLLIGFALSVLVFSYVLGLTGQLLEEFAGLQQYLGDAKGYLGILMKVVGITYLCEFSAGICKDAGYGAVDSPPAKNRPPVPDRTAASTSNTAVLYRRPFMTEIPAGSR